MEGGGAQYLHSVCQTVRIGVLKLPEKGAFKVRIRMSANLGKGGLFWTENSRKSEERGGSKNVLVMLKGGGHKMYLR